MKRPEETFRRGEALGVGLFLTVLSLVTVGYLAFFRYGPMELRWTPSVTVVTEEVVSPGRSAPAALPEEIGPIELNTATWEELQRLPGIGPVYARRIVAYRETYGPYRDIRELLEVDGIGERTLDKIRVYLTVNGES